MIQTLSGEVRPHLSYDVVIIGGGPAGITLALELRGSGKRVALFEGGSRSWTAESQQRYEGEVSSQEGPEYPPFDVFRLRHFGGTSNHWNGWCRPLEDNVFGDRPWLENANWPLTLADLAVGYRRAHTLCELGAARYEAEELCRDAGCSSRFARPTR